MSASETSTSSRLGSSGSAHADAGSVGMNHSSADSAVQCSAVRHGVACSFPTCPSLDDVLERCTSRKGPHCKGQL